MYSAADLPLNARGAVYHLDLLPEELADIVITVGDPDRVELVSRYFDSVEFIRTHREFHTHTGYIGSQRVSVISTGIGIPNIDIVLTELDALKNIDLIERKPKANLNQLDIIRLGTTGALQADISLGAFILSRYAIGFDTLLNYYVNDESNQMDQFTKQLKSHFSREVPGFYVTSSDKGLNACFNHISKEGITATCGGFYGPQGRVSRLNLNYPNFMNDLQLFKFDGYQVTNLEMETAAILGLGGLLGHRCTSLSVVLANRMNHTFCDSVDEHVQALIKSAIPVIENLGR